ncbi:Small GTPase superfamily [Ascosphaera apis ARSEF 7405]|uniref:Small GTPase superfamily n=1 Tax=Ascosphaera apis ARSEF 7405 TaxID=392613 RepID=A0A168CCH2_9EURO|nr:Small GTPase superfamily [Ascosphaera apis ARSEF 7405]
MNQTQHEQGNPIPITSQATSSQPIVKVLIVGDGGCGKSTFLSRLSLGQHHLQPDEEGSNGPSPILENEAPEAISGASINPLSSLPVLNDSDQPYMYTVRLGYRRFQLAFYDMSYLEKHWSLLDPDVVIMTYDITSRAGLGQLKEWRRTITRSFQIRRVNENDGGDVENGYVEVDREKIQIMLLGLKRDLRREEPGVIYPQEAYRIAQELHCDAYAECSAVTGELIPQVFEDIVRLAVLSKTGKKSEQGGCFIL